MKITSTKSPTAQLTEFVGRYDPAVAKLVHSTRRALRKQMPTAIEQVYDGYNFIAIGFCTTERTSDCIASLAVSAKGVALSFYHGASLADPDKILLGTGKQNRFVRLENPKTLAQPAVQLLLREAIAGASTPLPASGKGYTMIKSVAAKQRPRRTQKR
jgi:hypothetical protein